MARKRDYGKRSFRGGSPWKRAAKDPALRQAVQDFGGRELRRLLPNLSRNVTRETRASGK